MTSFFVSPFTYLGNVNLLANITGFDNVSNNITLLNTVLYNGTNYTIISIASNAFQQCNLQSVDFGNMSSLTLIDGSAFLSNLQLTELKNFTNASNLKSIGESAFQQCNLQSVDFGGMKELTIIDTSAFLYNNQLTELKNFTNASNIKSIGQRAFDDCNLQSVDFGNLTSLTSIESEAFLFNRQLTELKNFTNASNLQRIGSSAFNQCNLQSVDFGGMKSLTLIDGFAFFQNIQLTELKNFTNVSNLQSIGFRSFRRCNLQSVDFGGMKALTRIDGFAFFQNTQLSELKNFNYATNLKAISSSAFQSCIKIQTIFFPNNLTLLDTNCFNSNESLENVWFGNPSPLTISSNAFYDCTQLKRIYHYGTDVSQLTQLTSIANGTLYNLSSDSINYGNYNKISTAFSSLTITDEIHKSEIKNNYAANIIQVALNGGIFDYTTPIDISLGAIPFLAEQLTLDKTAPLKLYANYTSDTLKYDINTNQENVYFQMNIGAVLYLSNGKTITKNSNNSYTYDNKTYNTGYTITIDGRNIIFGGVTIGRIGSGGGQGGGGNEPSPIRMNMRSLFSNNAQVYYKPHSLAPGGIGGVKNYRIKSKKT